MVAELINKYLWLVETLRGGGERGFSFDEIDRKYRSEFGEAYPRRTFNNHRDAIAEVFGIEILCDRSTNRYFIPFVDDALDRDAAKQWLINTFTVNNLLMGSRDRLSGRVSVEDIPSGHRMLPVFLEAMKENRLVSFRYHKYTGNAPEERILAPYAVKEFEKRWYVLGLVRDRGILRVYGLDRIREIRILEETFRMPRDFDVNELFYNSFGVYLPEPGQKAVSVVLKTSEVEARFLRDLPLHHSQTEEKGPAGSCLFRLRVIPNANLIMALCRLGSRVEVLEPEELRSQVAAELRAASLQYTDKQNNTNETSNKGGRPGRKCATAYELL